MATATTDPKAWYIQIARDNGIEEEITDVDIVVPPLHGDHFASSCDYVTIHRKNAEPIELFTKRMVNNPEYSQKLRDMGVFVKEAAFFNSILPDIRKFAKSRAGSKTAYPLDIAPKCYFANEEFIVLENLSKQGYIMLDKIERQNLDQARFVLKRLAHLHAPSFVLLSEEATPSELIERYPSLAEKMLSEGNAAAINEMFVPILSTISLLLKTHPSDVTDFAVKLFGEFMAGMVQRLAPMLSTSDSKVGPVINHGDCWNNNMLFRPNSETQELTDHLFVDFQVSRIGSPNLDISYYLFTTVKHELRRKEWTNLLRVYYDALVQNVTTLKGSVKFSFEDFVDDYKQKFDLGFLFGVFMSGAMDAMQNIGNLDEIEGDMMQHFEKHMNEWVANNPDIVKTNVELLTGIFLEYKDLKNI